MVRHCPQARDNRFGAALLDHGAEALEFAAVRAAAADCRFACRKGDQFNRAKIEAWISQSVERQRRAGAEQQVRTEAVRRVQHEMARDMHCFMCFERIGQAFFGKSFIEADLAGINAFSSRFSLNNA